MSGLDELRRRAGISDEKWAGFKMGDRSARATVKDWHPKCETCGHYRRLRPSMTTTSSDCHHWQGLKDPDHDDYCCHHTSLRGEEE